MAKALSEAAAWELLGKIAAKLQVADLPGFQAFIVIGSLPGGYYQAGRSDLDALALFEGEKPSSLEIERLKQSLYALVLPLSDGADIEILPRFTTELEIDPATQHYRNPDLLARLITQARLLAGSFEASSLKMPGPADFKADLSAQLQFWQAAHGPLGACPPELQLKYLLLVMRNWLAITKGQLIYNKAELGTAYQQAKPKHALPRALESLLDAYLKGQPLQAGLEDEIAAFCEQLIEEISNFQT